jgi:GGDEF domain-containing protein
VTLSAASYHRAKQAELRLAWLADHDPLTGLYNRRRFQEELTYAVAAAERHERSGALLFLDLGPIQYINDTGHSRIRFSRWSVTHYEDHA